MAPVFISMSIISSKIIDWAATCTLSQSLIFLCPRLYSIGIALNSRLSMMAFLFLGDSLEGVISMASAMPVSPREWDANLTLRNNIVLFLLLSFRYGLSQFSCNNPAFGSETVFFP